MPAKRTRAAKAEQDSKESDAESKLAALLEELDVEVESRCQMLQSDAERMASWVRSEYKMLLEKLPKKVRAMTVADFFTQNASSSSEIGVSELQTLAAKYQSKQNESTTNEEEEGALAARTPFKVVSNANGSTTLLRSTRAAKNTSVMKSAVKRPAPEPEDPAPRTTRRTTRTQSIAATPAAPKTGGIVAQTPAFAAGLPFTPAHHGRSQPAGPATCLRLPKRGESIISATGNAIGTFESDATAQMFLDDQAKIAAFAMSTGQGEETVNLADPQTCAQLPKDVRLKAAKNVLAMQEQLEAMLANLR